MPQFGLGRDISVQCKIFIAFFVQCNILASCERLSIARSSATPRVRLNGRLDGKQAKMIKIDEVQKLSKDNVDATLKSFGAVSKASHAIATEVADYTKKSFEDGSKVMEKLFGVKSLDKAIEIQTDYAKTAYEGFVAQATKIGELYADLAKETYKPFETIMAKTAPAK
jgi:hypothetical protein